jgi:hypothetical protein
MVPVLNCRVCGGLTSAARFRYVCERLICDHCGAENPQTDWSHRQGIGAIHPCRGGWQ